MFKHTRAVASRLPRLLLASVLMATLALTLTTHQAANGTADTGSLPNAQTAANSFDPVQLPLSFVSNAGQVDSAVAFQANSLGGSLFFTPEDVVLMLPGVDQPHVVDVDFVGANANVDVIGADQLPGIVNYFIGNDPDAWLTNIPTYGAITYDNLYSGVSLNYTGTQGVLKSAYTVAAGADPSVIAWRYGGALDTRVDAATGDLHIVLDDTPDYGEVILVEQAPVAWQTLDGAQVSVDVGYTVSDSGTVRFELGDYDPAYALTLDPELLYSTFFGGITNDVGYAITTDTKGNVYITGKTDSTIFPEEPTGIPGNDLQGGVDAFVTKINVAISSQQMVYSTYLGGSQSDYGYGIALDSSNNAYVTGQTTSSNFPSYPPTGGGFDTGGPGRDGASDAFVVKMNASGTALLYSGYLGGNGDESGNAIVVDSVGNAYVTGYTTSNAGFPTTGGYDTSYNGSQDAFVTEIDPNGTSVVYSTYLGGYGADTGNGIGLYTNPGGDFAFVVGQAGFTFPVVNAPGNSCAAGLSDVGDGFLARIDGPGSTGLNFSKCIGGSNTDAATDLVVDQDGNAYVTGWTLSSSGFPISAGAKQSSLAGGTDAFITEFSATGDFLYGTYFGGADDDLAYAIDLDIEGIVHFAGKTSSSEATFPLEAPFQDRNPEPPTWDQLTLEVPPDAFVAGFDPLDTTPGSYLYSSYLGGMNDDPASPLVEDDAADIAYGLAVDVSGGVNVVGETSSAGFPQVRDTFQRGGQTDAFIAYMSSAKADLIIDKLGNGEATEETFVSPGSPLVYTIEVSNLGPNDSHNVQIEDTVPTGLISIGTITPPPGGSCSVNGNRVTCDIGTVRAPSFGNPIPDPVVVTIETTVLSGTSGQITNTVAITQSSTFDPNPSLDPDDENANAAEHIAFSVPDLELLAEANDYRVLSDPPDSFQYIFSIRNNSPVVAHNIVITGLTMPPGVENPVPTVPAYTTFDVGTGTWEIESPLTSSSGTLTLTIDVDVVFGTPIGTFLPITATATADEADKNPADNTDVLVRVKVVSPFGDTGCHPSPDDPANEVLCTSN